MLCVNPMSDRNPVLLWTLTRSPSKSLAPTVALPGRWDVNPPPNWFWPTFFVLLYWHLKFFYYTRRYKIKWFQDLSNILLFSFVYFDRELFELPPRQLSPALHQEPKIVCFYPRCQGQRLPTISWTAQAFQRPTQPSCPPPAHQARGCWVPSTPAPHLPSPSFCLLGEYWYQVFPPFVCMLFSTVLVLPFFVWLSNLTAAVFVVEYVQANTFSWFLLLPHLARFHVCITPPQPPNVACCHHRLSLHHAGSAYPLFSKGMSAFSLRPTHSSDKLMLFYQQCRLLWGLPNCFSWCWSCCVLSMLSFLRQLETPMLFCIFSRYVDCFVCAYMSCLRKVGIIVQTMQHVTWQKKLQSENIHPGGGEKISF